MASKINPDLFTAQPVHDETPCPQCGAALLLRHGKHGPFLGCSAYPACDYIKPLHHNDGHIVKHLGVPCPVCEHELVLRQGRYGMFIGCSHYPECNHIEPQKASSSVSEDDEPARSCPECGAGHLVKRNSRHGKVFYGCDSYPKCKFVLNAQPVEGPCEVCGYPLLVLKKHSGGEKKQCANRKCQHLQQN
ncbi:type I DNA topoisomerase [Photobacterium sp. 1_MG-2023]|uniref:DNA topoisomerase family protein n=1 Tax=Photobacterium sp. 1_MG-2023 TaxID=3062646 RepID=UPI0026E3169C|nr:topoisomerase DNA-binding C4 zinc finger domain-containing protein [Photobacterium sp. 1_MG-2023]MDO6707751.1 topoisomerase DNA-binding C4 zinc finger domain-containing protein [Photobacterium sp. 1_MG-2023]